MYLFMLFTGEVSEGHRDFVRVDLHDLPVALGLLCFDLDINYDL